MKAMQGLAPIVVIIVVTCDILCVTPQLLGPAQYKLSEDGRLTFPGIAAKYGHPCTENYVITHDGYNLTLYHIPGDSQRPVLLVHGNLPSSECWILRGNTSLAITLAEQGYDVWAINLRGSRHSRRHISLDPDKDSAKFFNFSFYEQAMGDIPATIDYILEKTGQNQLLAVGHSLATTLFYIMGAEKPEYNHKIKLAISLGPISYHQHVRGIAATPPSLTSFLLEIAGLLNINEMFTHDLFTPLQQLFCLNPLGYEMCVNVGYSAICGHDNEGFEPEFLNSFIGHMPAGVSRKSLQHLIQIQSRNKFANYDHGVFKNLAVYGRAEPPEFDLSKVTMKMALMVGQGDYLGTEQDTIRLKAALPNVVYYKLLPYKNFNHFDFAWGRNMSNNLYPYLLPLIEKYI